MAYIEFKDVSKVYRMGQTEMRALDHISFSVEKGELCVIVGPSGAGKTTLLNILGGMDAPTEGTILLDGREISAQPRADPAPVPKPMPVCGAGYFFSLASYSSHVPFRSASTAGPSTVSRSSRMRAMVSI